MDCLHSGGGLGAGVRVWGLLGGRFWCVWYGGRGLRVGWVGRGNGGGKERSSGVGTRRMGRERRGMKRVEKRVQRSVVDEQGIGTPNSVAATEVEATEQRSGKRDEASE